MCCTIILNIFIIVIIGCPILNCMIQYDYNVCNDKGKYCTILWHSGNYCGQWDLVMPIGFKIWVHTLYVLCVTPTISSTAPTSRPHFHPWICGHTPWPDRSCWPDGGISWLVDQTRDDRTPPQTRVKGVGRQQQFMIY